MTEQAASERAEIVCPHCGKTFEAKLLEGGGGRHRGYKCPHCKLFVPADRADPPDEAS